MPKATQTGEGEKKERERKERKGKAKEGATGGSCYQRKRRRRDDAGGGDEEMDWGWGERDEDRLSTALVPGWIPEMFDADSFINANLTA